MSEVQGLLESKDTHRPKGGPVLLGIWRPGRASDARDTVACRIPDGPKVDTWSKVDVTCVKSLQLLLCGACPQMA